jgi:hypothetical protein
MSRTLHERRYLARLLALSLVFLTLVFVAQVSLHVHTSGQEELTCQICHAAQVDRIQLAPNVAWATLVVIERVLPAENSPFYVSLFARDHQSRAPPLQA